MTHPSPYTGKLTKNGTGTFRPGKLRDTIHSILQSDPSKAWSISEVTAKLHRDSGAVPQALDKLVDLGLAVRVPPGRRYQTTTTAGTAPPPAPVCQQLPPAPTVSGPVRRPNGDLYYPRLLGGKPDVQVLRKLRANGIAVLLYGPPGTGKTSLIEAAYGDDLHTLSGDGDTAVGDLLGDYVPDGAGYRFVDGPLVRAMESGGVFFIDDATLISPKVLAVVYPAMDGRREITVKAHGSKTVKAAPGFFVAAGHNPGVHGAILTEALASRFTAHIKVTTDFDLALRLGVPRQIVRVAIDLNRKCDNAEIGWAPQLRELLGFKHLSAALGADAAIANLIGISPPEDRDVVTAVVKALLPQADRNPLALGNQI